jgi:uncharacterized membrane protein (DUF4010 family)
MEFVEAFQRLGASLAIGLLVGCERGWQDRELPAGSRTAGIRTFGLSGFLGGLAGYIQEQTGPVIPAVLLLLFGTAFIGFKRREASNDGDYGVTTVVAALVVAALGLLAVVGDLRLAAAGAVATTAILAAKRSLHHFLQQLTWLEMRGALVLLAMTLIALPLLPDRPIDPWGALNPFTLWLLTITIPAISFVGYVAIRVAGPRRGILFAGAAGGLVSSTALTLSFGRFAREAPESARQLASGAMLASTLSLVRVVVIAVAIAPVLLRPLAVTLTPAALVFLCAVAVTGRFGDIRGDTRGIDVKNPFDLTQVMRFGALLCTVAVLSQVAVEKMGQASLFPIAAVSGLLDIDAITLSIARLTGTTVDAAIAPAAILTAVTANLLTKMMLAFTAAGRGPYATAIALATLAAITAGTITYLLSNLT